MIDMPVSGLSAAALYLDYCPNCAADNRRQPDGALALSSPSARSQCAKLPRAAPARRSFLQALPDRKVTLQVLLRPAGPQACDRFGHLGAESGQVLEGTELSAKAPQE